MRALIEDTASFFAVSLFVLAVGMWMAGIA